MLKKLKESINEILDETFIGDKKYLKSTNYSIQFACPYCLDSQKSDRKKRAHLYFDSMRFNCYNCGVNKNLFSFLSDFGKISKFSYDELDKIDTEIKDHAETHNKIKESVNIDVLFDATLINKIAISRNNLKKHFNLKEIKDTPAEKYLKGRAQTDFSHYLYSEDYNSIWILNRTSTDKIIGCQMRIINKSNNRYFTFSIKELYTQFGFEITDDILSIEKISLIFNILRVDLSKQLLVLEGPFDAFLLNNAIATLGSKKSLPFAFDDMIFIDDYDKDGYAKSRKMIDDGFKIFLWDKFLDDHSELVKHFNRSKKVDITDVITTSQNYAIPLKSFAQYFSNDIYDLYYL